MNISNTQMHKNDLVMSIYAFNSTYPPFNVGVKPNSMQILTDINKEQTTVTTALKANPILDFTMSILPEEKTEKKMLI